MSCSQIFDRNLSPPPTHINLFRTQIPACPSSPPPANKLIQEENATLVKTLRSRPPPEEERRTSPISRRQADHEFSELPATVDAVAAAEREEGEEEEGASSGTAENHSGCGFTCHVRSKNEGGLSLNV